MSILSCRQADVRLNFGVYPPEEKKVLVVEVEETKEMIFECEDQVI